MLWINCIDSGTAADKKFASSSTYSSIPANLQLSGIYATCLQTLLYFNPEGPILQGIAFTRLKFWLSLWTEIEVDQRLRSEIQPNFYTSVRGKGGIEQ